MAAADEQAGPCRTVLLVDDEPHIVKALKRLLRKDRYHVYTAFSGEEAFEILQQHRVAVIVCDQRMPGMSGAELLSKAYELQPDGYRITLTGYTDMESAQQSINEGHIHRFLVKPWDDDTLRRIVADGIQSFQLTDENRRLQKLTAQQNQKLEAWNKDLETQVAKRTRELETRNTLLTKVQAQTERSLADFVVVFASLLELTSPALGIHSRRVAQTAQQIGKLIDADAQLQREIVYAAHLHDIGKLAELSTRETQSGKKAARQRPDPAAMGATILSRIHGFKRIAEGIKHQHERHDGTGKPRGLKHQQVPIIARVIHTANLYDEAVFRPAQPTEPDYKGGLEAIEQSKGGAIDPLLAELLIKHLLTQTEPVETEVELSYSQLRKGMRLSKDLCNIEGVLMLKAGTELNEDLLDKIRLLCQHEMMLNSICVITQVPPMGDPEEADPLADESTDKPSSEEPSEAGRVAPAHNPTPKTADANA